MTAIARIANAFAGMIATNTDSKNCRTGTSEEASAEIRFGIMVKQGTADDGVKLITAQNSILKGVVVADGPFAKDQELGDTGLKPKAVMDVLDEGDIHVLCEETVVIGDAVRVRISANGGNTVVGAFCKTADTVHTIDISKWARWVRGGGATSPPIVHLNALNQALTVADS